MADSNAAPVTDQTTYPLADGYGFSVVGDDGLVQARFVAPWDECFDALKTLHQVENGQLTRFLHFVFRVQEAVREAPEPEDAFWGFWNFILAQTNVTGRRLESPEEQVLSLTYKLLQNGVTRGNAAAIATLFLKKPKPIGTEAWRKRLDRWAEKEGLPPVGKPRPYRRKSQPPN